MTDTRTRREKLEAMASQDVSPNEAAIARRILDEMGPEPIVAESPSPEPAAWFWSAYSMTVDQWLARWEADERERRRQEAIARRRRERAAADQAGPNRENRPRWWGATVSAHSFVTSMGIRCARCGESKAASIHSGSVPSR